MSADMGTIKATLVIARHGNTFSSGDTPTRVGARTDLPLVGKGEEQARALGRYLKEHDLLPDVVYSSNLQRTRKMAELALKEAGAVQPVYALDIFDEIDYGVDENKPEDEVIARVGKEALKLWNEKAIVPDGWRVNPDEIIRNWQRFANQIVKADDTLNPLTDTLTDTITNQVMDIAETTLVVTSNGIARFAPYITGDFEDFLGKFSIKLKTGALGILRFFGDRWVVEDWNIVPVLV